MAVGYVTRRASRKNKKSPWGSGAPGALNPGLRRSTAKSYANPAQTVTAYGGGVHRASCFGKNKTEPIGLCFIFGGDEGYSMNIK